MNNEGKLNIIRPFGPAIGETTIPKKIVDKINNFVDEVIKDKKKSKELDWGKSLAGQVTQEIALPNEFLKDEILNFFVSKLPNAFRKSFLWKRRKKIYIF